MKKNLYLFGALVALLIGTYIFQEVRTSDLFKANLIKDHLLREGDIKSLSFEDVVATKVDGQWWADKRLLSFNIFKQIEKRLVQIKKIKSVPGDKQNFFTNPKEFKVNGETWTLGDLTLDRQGFYIARDNEVMIAISEGETQELSEAPEKVVETKLEDLRKGLSYKLSDLYETQLFRYYPKLPLGTVTIESDGRPSFELDFDKNATLPPPFHGIFVHEKLLDKFVSLLTQMTIKKEVPYSESLKFAKMGNILFQNEAEEKVDWELWLSSANNADSYIIDSKNKRAYNMVGGTLKIFFIQIQDYWDKKVIPPKEFRHFFRMNTTFTQGAKSAVVEIINREPLQFAVKGYKVDEIKMNILLQYLFNLSEKDQADRVSNLSKSERKELLSGNHLRVEIFNQDILFWRKADELILVNLTQGFKAHFLVTEQTFRATFEDVLK